MAVNSAITTGNCTVKDIVRMMERIAPIELSEDWDNCGLQIGAHNWPVEKVLIALDPSEEVMQYAADQNADMVITHHPLLFQPLKSIDMGTPLGRIVELAVNNGTALYSAHTNLDSAEKGVNDILAITIGLTELTALVPASGPVAGQQALPQLGLGRVGRLAPAMSVKAFARHAKEKLNVHAVKVAGNPELEVSRAAICSGSGGSLIDHFLQSPAQVYVSGDLRYHDARLIEEAGRALIDVGHFSSEHIIIDRLVELLTKEARAEGVQLLIEPCRVERDPFMLV